MKKLDIADVSGDGWLVPLTRENPRQEFMLPISMLLGNGANYPANDTASITAEDVRLIVQAMLPKSEGTALDGLIANRISDLEQRIAALASDRVPAEALPRFLGGTGAEPGQGGQLIDTIERIVALENAVDAIERKLSEPAKQEMPIAPIAPVATAEQDDDLPSFLRKEQDNRQGETEKLKHDIANLQQQMQAMAEMLREPPRPLIPPLRDLAIANIEAAGRARRAAAAPHGDTDPALGLNLTTIAHYANSGHEAAFTTLGALAEANGLPAEQWSHIAADLVQQSDAAMRIAVRTYAVEIKAKDEIKRTTSDDMISKLADGAIAAIRAIEG